MSTQISWRDVAGEDPQAYIDCDRCIRSIYSRIQHHIREDDGSCAVCRYLGERIGSRDGSESDARLLLHAQINLIWELFMRKGDTGLLALLQRVEDDCC